MSLNPTRKRIQAAAFLAFTVLFLFWASQARSATISHVYDAAGRLTGSTYGNGQSTSYTLDASGNITAYLATGSLGTLSHVISASATSGGQITPSGDVEVEHGQSQSFQIAASQGYKTAYILVDRILQATGPSYQFNSVSADHVIKAGFVSLTDDTDNDKLSDAWELSSFGTLARDGTGDYDNDGLTDAREQALGTNPGNRDSDGDGMYDGWEITYRLDPLANDAAVDSDGDGFSNIREYRADTDPANAWYFPVYGTTLPMLYLLINTQ